LLLTEDWPEAGKVNTWRYMAKQTRHASEISDQVDLALGYIY